MAPSKGGATDRGKATHSDREVSGFNVRLSPWRRGPSHSIQTNSILLVVGTLAKKPQVSNQLG